MQYLLPELGEGVYEAELVEWLACSGQAVRHGDPLAEVMTDKATLELPAPFTGTIETLLAEPGQIVKIGEPLLTYALAPGATASGQAADDAAVVSLAATVPGAGTGAGNKASGNGSTPSAPSHQASPAVRKMARALGVDLSSVRGTGPAGRVLIDDLGNYVNQLSISQAPRDVDGTGEGNEEESAGHSRRVARPLRPGQRVALQGLRRSIADHMVTSKQTIPHYSYIDECDVSRMVALRNALKRPLYGQGVKLTNLPFYVKAVVGALQQVPIVNSTLDCDAGEIVLHDRYDIGIATATARGLVVPVIRGADQKNLAEIARDIERLIRAAQSGTIARGDLQGSTFTISSIGNFGGLVSTPIIHHPEVGIVAIGKIFKRPTYDDQGQIVPAQIVYLSFSFDHRVVDGSVGAQFGNAMIQQLQDPQTLALGIPSHETT